MPRRTHPVVLAVAALAVAAVTPLPAAAHKLDVTATAGPPHPTEVRVVAGYDTDDPAAEATVTLADAAGVEVARGTTDAGGECTLPRPPAGPYTVTVDDGAGHRTTITLDVPESPEEVAAAASERRNRWLMAAAGLSLIAGGSWLARRLLRRPAESKIFTAEGVRGAEKTQAEC